MNVALREHKGSGGGFFRTVVVSSGGSLRLAWFVESKGAGR